MICNLKGKRSSILQRFIAIKQTIYYFLQRGVLQNILVGKEVVHVVFAESRSSSQFLFQLQSNISRHLCLLCTLQSTRKMLYWENINPHCVMFLFIKQSWCDSSQSSSGQSNKPGTYILAVMRVWVTDLISHLVKFLYESQTHVPCP